MRSLLVLALLLPACALRAESELFCDELCVLRQPVETTGKGDGANSAVPGNGDGGSAGDGGGGGAVTGSGGTGGAEPTGCTSDAECRDNDPCNGQEACSFAHKCYTSVGPPSTDDNNACTIDFCQPGGGVHHQLIDGIDDRDPCTHDTCDPATAEIFHSPIQGCHN